MAYVRPAFLDTYNLVDNPLLSGDNDETDITVPSDTVSLLMTFYLPDGGNSFERVLAPQINGEWIAVDNSVVFDDLTSYEIFNAGGAGAVSGRYPIGDPIGDGASYYFPAGLHMLYERDTTSGLASNALSYVQEVFALPYEAGGGDAPPLPFCPRMTRPPYPYTDPSLNVGNASPGVIRQR